MITSTKFGVSDTFMGLDQAVGCDTMCLAKVVCVTHADDCIMVACDAAGVDVVIKNLRDLHVHHACDMGEWGDHHRIHI